MKNSSNVLHYGSALVIPDMKLTSTGNMVVAGIFPGEETPSEVSLT